jgi:hypothetical protein
LRLNHEPTDIPLTGTTRASLVTLGVLVVVGVLMYVASGYFASKVRERDAGLPPLAEAGYGQRQPAGPRLQAVPGDDLSRHMAAQHAKLDSYAWVDRNAGVVRIPIERAIELMASRASTIADPSAAGTAAAPAPPPAAAPTPAPAAPTAPAAPGH